MSSRSCGEKSLDNPQSQPSRTPATNQQPRFDPAWHACLHEVDWSRTTTTASLLLRVLCLLLAIAAASRQCGYFCDN